MTIDHNTPAPVPQASLHRAVLVVEALPAVFALRTGQLAAQCGVPLVSSMYYFNREGLDAEDEPLDGMQDKPARQ